MRKCAAHPVIADSRLGGIRPATETSEFVRHVPRETNTRADAMSRGESDRLEIQGPPESAPVDLRLTVDGSHSSRGVGCGRVLWSATAPTDSGPSGFREMAKAHWQLPHWLRPIDTELCALQSGLSFVRELAPQNHVGIQARPTPGSLEPSLLRIASRPRLWPMAMLRRARLTEPIPSQ